LQLGPPSPVKMPPAPWESSKWASALLKGCDQLVSYTSVAVGTELCRKLAHESFLFFEL
jgi:hypothetical protein